MFAKQPPMPDPSVDQRLLGNLRRSRIEMEELGVQFDELMAKLDEEIRQQKLHRVKKSVQISRSRNKLTP
jgi:hypothetical protein